MAARSMTRFGTLALLAGLAVSACGDDGSGPGGDSFTIEMRDNSFNPPSPTVDVGTTVRWVNEGSVAHNTTSETQIWASADLQPDGSYSRAFNTAGTFPYECTIHSGMEGTITVQ